MEIRDYVRMLRRGWPVIILITVAFVGLTIGYLQVAPKRYEARAVLYVAPNEPRSFDDLVQGSSFAGNAVATYAEITDSAVVLAPAAASLTPQRSVVELNEMVSAEVRPETRLIDITATASDPAEAAAVVNAAARSATRVIPSLDLSRTGRELVSVDLLREAAKPTQASSPVVKRTLALGVIVGACIGLGVTIAAQALDTRLRRVDDIRSLTDVPLLAIVPPLTRAERHGLPARDQPNGPAAEAYHTLRTNMRFRAAKQGRTFVFASVADDRYGAQLPVNLAWTLARSGQRVLLVDLDLRHSRVGEALDIPSRIGAADLLMGNLSLAEAIHPTGQSHLGVIVAGTTQPTPPELLSSPQLAQLLREVEQDFDYVILHAPPVLDYTDAALIAGFADGTFISISAGRTRAHELSTALAALANVGVRPLGMMLTGARKSALNHGTVAGQSTHHSTERPSLQRVELAPVKPDSEGRRSL